MIRPIIITRGVRGVIAAFVFAVCFGSGSIAIAQENRNEREIQAARERVQQMLREAEELQELGRTERAGVLRREAESLRTRIEQSLARLRGEGEGQRRRERGGERERARGERREREGGEQRRREG